VTWYLSSQLLLAVVWVAAVGLLATPMSARWALRVARAGLLGALVAPGLVALLPESAWRPEPQVFASPGMDGATALAFIAADGPGLLAPPGTASFAGTLAVLALASALIWAVLSFLALRRALASTTALRSIGSVHLRLGDRSFAAWRPGRTYVVLERGLASSTDRRIALAHELQHHRHGDPRFAWLLLGIRVASAWNPFAHMLARRLAALEELACDEAVLARTSISPRAYGGCLLRAVASPSLLPMASGLHHPTLLTRRIHMLTSPPAPRRLLALPLTLGLLGCLLGTAWAAAGAVETRAPSPETVAAVAARASHGGFVVPEHPAVQSAIERITTRSKTARFFADGIDKRPAFAELVDGALAAYDLPPQLAAVPLVESGYTNLGEYSEGRSAAPGVPGKGLWMFIPSTARTYDLRVDDTVDERLDLAKETDAAMRLLRDLHVEFGDWGLALAAYNQGSRVVRDAIEAEGTRDALELSSRGALNHYVPMVMAAALLLQDPSLLD